MSGDGQRPDAVRGDPGDAPVISDAPAVNAAPVVSAAPAVSDAPVAVPAWQRPAGYNHPTEVIPVRRAARQERTDLRRVPDPPPDEFPLWPSDDDTVPDGGWLVPPAPKVDRRVPRDPRRPALGLPTLVILASLAAFFGWVSAEPLWLALGHAERGTATVTGCTGSGLTERCVGDFTAPGFAVQGVALLNLAPAQRDKDAQVPALMVTRHSSNAYAAPGATLGLHVRWAIGLLLTLLCGVGIAWASGAPRLREPRARRWAVLLSLTAPLLLAATFLATAR